MTEPKNIVIIGGGFAGTTLARELDRKLPPGYDLILTVAPSRARR